MQHITTLIIGAGQSGLSLSYCLTQKKIDHLILEKGEIAEDIRNRRWDSFRLITPNHMTRLPGFPYNGTNPQGFDTRDAVVQFLEAYARSFHAPVKEHTPVISVERTTQGFIVKTPKEDFAAKNVVVAIGSFHKPLIPPIAGTLPKSVHQIHSSAYKNEKQLPQGSVLIVGGGNSGVQIAVDLNNAGRKVYLSVGRLRIVPRTYRGKDFMEWANLMGALDRTTEQATPEIKATLAPLLFGNDETVDLRKLAKDGIQMLGRLQTYAKGIFSFSDDFSQNLEKGEAALAGFKTTVDTFIDEKKHNLPVEKEAREDFEMQTLPSLDMQKHSITSLIWATGFKDDYSFVKIPVFDELGEPIHKKGVSNIPGLYFIGLRWLSKYKSFLLCGVEEDARYLAQQITE